MGLVKDKEVAIVSAVSRALDIMKSDMEMPSEEIIQRVLGNIRGNTEAKISAIAAVNSAVKMRRENPSMLSREIIERVNKDLKKNSEE